MGPGRRGAVFQLVDMRYEWESYSVDVEQDFEEWGGVFRNGVWQFRLRLTERIASLGSVSYSVPEVRRLLSARSRIVRVLFCACGASDRTGNS